MEASAETSSTSLLRELGPDTCPPPQRHSEPTDRPAPPQARAAFSRRSC